MKATFPGRKTLLLSSVLVMILWQRDALVEVLRIIADQQAVGAYLDGYGALGPVMLFLLLVAQVFVAVIPGHALMVTAGYVYGLAGLALVISSTVLGSQLAFLVSRRYGRDLVYRLASRRAIDRWDLSARYEGILFYFFAFVVPVVPSDLMCYVAGLGRISPGRFFVSNLLGRTCCAVFITVIGMYGLHPPIEFWIVAGLSILAIAAGWGVHRKLRTETRTEAGHD